MKEILIYGPIGETTDARDVVRQFQEASGEDVLLRIHSEGGNVLDGEAILNAMRQHDGEVSARIEGMAFSMAAIIALEVGRDSLTMPEDGFIMFHEVRNYGGGTEEDLERQLQQMRTMNESIASKLSNALSISEEEAASRLKEEIWMNGTEALEAGLVSSLTPSRALAARFDSTDFKNAPRNLFGEVGQECPTTGDQDKTIGTMKFFKLFKTKEGDPSLELAEVGPEDIGPELAALKMDLDEQKATHIAALVARDETHANTLKNALEEQRAEIEEEHKEEIAEKDKAIEVAEASSEEKANETLSQAGHDPVEVLEEDSGTNEEKIKAEYAAINIQERGGVERRRAFRKNHKEIFGG